MSNLGKTLLYLALVGALVDIYAAYASYQRFDQDKTTITTTKATLATTQSNLASETKLQEQTAATLATTTASLTDANAKNDDLTAKLAAEDKTLADTNTALTKAQADAKTAQDQLETLTKALGGKSPDELNALVKQQSDDLAAKISEIKVLQDSLQASEAHVAQLKVDINNSHLGIIPPGVSGQVTFVNRPWNFVVLNVGLANGVVPNGELIIYRGRDFLGKVKVTSSETNSCVADILPDAKADIQVGDSVLN
jgi:Tfp pilus assembly protein PilE